MGIEYDAWIMRINEKNSKYIEKQWGTSIVL